MWILAEEFIWRRLDVEPWNVLSGVRLPMFDEGVCFIYSESARAKKCMLTNIEVARAFQVELNELWLVSLFVESFRKVTHL